LTYNCTKFIFLVILPSTVCLPKIILVVISHENWVIVMFFTSFCYIPSNSFYTEGKMLMNGFDITNCIFPATQAADKCGKKHHFIHIIQLVVSPSLPCYNLKIGFTQLLGLNFVNRKTTKITKNKYSIRRLACRSGIKIDTSLKTGRYWTKAHASCAILQETRTARLLAAGCQKVVINYFKKRKRCNNQIVFNGGKGRGAFPRHPSSQGDDGKIWG
jgi:hypothetical protein